MMTTTSLLSILLAGCSGTPTEEPAAPPHAGGAPATAPEGNPHAVIVSGTIEAPAEAPEAQAVYVSLKAGDNPGPPLAAKRLPPGPFPLAFSITEADRPMSTGPLPAQVQLKVTLDVDGEPMIKSDTDLESITSVERGATGVSVTLAPR